MPICTRADNRNCASRQQSFDVTNITRAMRTPLQSGVLNLYILLFYLWLCHNKQLLYRDPLIDGLRFHIGLYGIEAVMRRAAVLFVAVPFGNHLINTVSVLQLNRKSRCV